MHTPPYPTADSDRPRSRGLAVAASALVWIAGAPGPLTVFASAVVLGSDASTSAFQLGAVQVSGGHLVTCLGTAVAGVAVIRWLWWAWANATGVPRTWSQPWVIAGWFVPVLNLWVPVAIVSDIARAGLREGDPAASRLRATIAVWWAAWLGAWVAQSVALTGASGLDTPYRWYAVFSGLSALLFVVASGTFTSLALQIADRQDAPADPPTVPLVLGTTSFPPPPPTEPRRRTPVWLVPTVLGGVVVLAVATAVALVAGSDDPPAELAAAAVEDAGGWSGVNYSGTAAGLDGTPVQFDITVTGKGARGTLSRDGGRARAEVVQDRTGVLFKGNAAWWQHSHPERTEQLADTWVTDPGIETFVIEPILQLDPTELSGEVRPGSASLWEKVGERSVDGQPAIVLSNGFRLLIVTAEQPYRLLAIDLHATDPQKDEPIRITLVTPAQAAEIADAATRIRSAESPRPFMQQLLLRPRADIQVQPEPLCTNPMCTASFVVTNIGEIPIRGRFQMTAEGSSAGSARVDLQPGESATFNSSAPNPGYNGGGTTGQIYWVGEVILD